MNLPFEADDPRDADIVWRRAGQGTFFFIDSKVPEGYRVLGITAAGQRADLDHSEFFQSVTFVNHQPLLSRPYDSIKEAKNACEFHRRFRVFPPPEKFFPGKKN